MNLSSETCLPHQTSRCSSCCFKNTTFNLGHLCNSCGEIIREPWKSFYSSGFAYKIVTPEWLSPFYKTLAPTAIPLKYQIGTTVEITEANTDHLETCGAGINLGTRTFIEKAFQEIIKEALALKKSTLEIDEILRTWHVVKCSFKPEDIAAVPILSLSSKFRVYRCQVLEEIPISDFICGECYWTQEKYQGFRLNSTTIHEAGCSQYGKK